jgi:hypothetical protein
MIMMGTVGVVFGRGLDSFLFSVSAWAGRWEWWCREGDVFRCGLDFLSLFDQ